MLLKTYLVTPKYLRLTKKQIDDNFGEKLRGLGFVPRNSSLEWYAIKNGKLFCSIYFDESLYHNILYRIQPFCTRIIHPLKKNKHGVADRVGFCESALRTWKQRNSELYDVLEKQQITGWTNEEVISNKLDFYRELLDTVVIPYFETVNEFSDIVCTRDFEIIAANAYLSANADAYYGSAFVANALSNIVYSRIGPEEDNEIKAAIRKAGEERDMTIVGKCMQKRELENIEYVRTRIPKLFKNNPDFSPMITDEFINNFALTEVRTTYDYKLSIPDSVQKIPGVEYVPFPMSAPNPLIDPEASRKKAESVIEELFSDELRSRGFVSHNGLFEWYKLKDETILYRILFMWSDVSATIWVYYMVSTIYDEIELKLTIKNIPERAGFDFLKLINSPNLLEHYPNSFDSGEEVLKWQISRLQCQMHYVIFPYFEKYSTLDMLSDMDTAAAILSGQEEKVSSHLLRSLREQAEYKLESGGEKALKRRPAKLSQEGFKWSKEKHRILAIGFYHNDMEYIREYYRQCQEFNLKFLRNEIPELFE